MINPYIKYYNKPTDRDLLRPLWEKRHGASRWPAEASGGGAMLKVDTDLTCQAS